MIDLVDNVNKDNLISLAEKIISNQNNVSEILKQLKGIKGL